MRVLFVSQTYISAFNRQKLRLIARQGVEVALLAPSNWQHRGGLFAGRPALLETPQADAAIAVTGAQTWRPGHDASFLFDPRTVRKTLADFSPDLVQVELETYSFGAAQFALQMKRRQKLVLFSWENLDRPLPLIQRVARQIALRRADGLLSGNSAGIALAQAKGYRGPAQVLPQLGVDPAQFAKRPPPAPGAPLTLGFIGRLVPEKGGETFLRAAALLAARGHDFRLSFCGAGPCLESWKALAGQLGLSPRLTWHGSVPHAEVPALLAAMDLLVLPSQTTPTWCEQFGLVLAQAMMMGVPVAGSDSGAIPEVIGRPDAIFPEGNAEALAQILGRAVSDRAELARWSRLDFAKASASYSSEHIAGETVRFWNAL